MAKKSAKDKPAGPATIHNRKARYDFDIIDTYEAGVVLVGSEVKSIYNGRVNMTDAFVRVVNDEVWMIQCDIEMYKFSTAWQPERRRDIKLLLHAKEIMMLERKANEKGLAVIPLKMYFKNGRVKVEIGLGRGRKQYDKRDKIEGKDTRREKEEVRRMRG